VSPSRYARAVQSEQVFSEGSASVRAARRFVAKTLSSWGHDDAVWDAQLVVSELATNAVLHAGTPFTVRLTLQGRKVRLEVDDGVSRAPRERRFGPDATTGRGIGLVAEVSASWGVSMRPGGKSVWCELSGTTDRDLRGTQASDEEPDLDAFLDEADGADGSGAVTLLAA
jgi:anti-sigma regulatory factor (Ser/Thr protein kinase)